MPIKLSINFKERFIMRIKKIISISLAAIMSFLLLSTTAMAYSKSINRYNSTYNFTGKGNEMSWIVKGTSKKARTEAGNPTSYSRYVVAYTAKRNVDSRATISSKSDNSTGAKVYANAVISRSMTNQKHYFVHQATLSPSNNVSYIIDSLVYNVYQYPNS